MLSKYKNIIWDWNGTLLDDAWLCVDIMNSLLSRQNLPKLSLESYQNIFRFPIRTYYDSLGFDYIIEPFEKVATDFITIYEERKFECELSDHATIVLDYFRANNKRQYILSASKIDSLNEITQHYGLQKYFQSLSGLDDHYAHGKVDIGKKLISNEKMELGNTILIGDTDHDCEVAAQLGIKSILVLNGHNSMERLQQCDSLFIKSLNELIRD